MDHSATATTQAQGAGTTASMREQVRHAVHHAAHRLSEQGPMNITFVHNNTLLGLQKQHFTAAIAEAQRVLGGRGYLTNDAYRAHYRSGRIEDSDIAAAFALTVAEADLTRVVARIEDRDIQVGELRGLHLRHGIEPIDAAQLRWGLIDGDLRSCLRADLPEPTRASLLRGAALDTTAERARIARDWTIAHWLHALTGVDVPSAVRRAVLEELNGDRAFVEAIEPNLRALGVPEAAWGGYLACIDQALGGAVKEGQAARSRELWLREERVRNDVIARRHLGVGGDLVSLDAWIGANPQAYATAALWQAAVGAYGLADPFGRSDPLTLQELDPALAATESIARMTRHMQHFGGPPLSLRTGERAVIEQLVRDQVQVLAQAGDDSGSVREQARLCWLVLHELGETHLDRLGADALRSLVSLLPESDASRSLAALLDERDPRQRMAAYARRQLDADLHGLRHGRSHADFLAQLTGDDAGERVNRYLIRICAAFLDDGLAAWRMPARSLGFFDAWRSLAASDHSLDFEGVEGWRDALHALPALPEDAVIHCLRQLGVAPADWDEYLGRELSRLKGWAGMAFWFELHPRHEKQAAQPISTLQLVAVRLFCETQIVRRTCAALWSIEPQVDSIGSHFSDHLNEYMVLRAFHAGHLSDDLAEAVRALSAHPRGGGELSERWAELADLAWLQHESDLSPRREQPNVFREGWRLFTLAQLLGLRASSLRALSAEQRDNLLAELDAFPADSHGYTWLIAFEHHYRDEVLNAIALNHGRGRWQRRDQRPKSQVIFCIDEREENIHRHYEELDPGHETLGAAGFFGVALSYSGLDDHDRTPLCPAVATPAHRVYEVPRDAELEQRAPLHHRRRGWLSVIQDTYWEVKRNVVSSYFTIDLLGFLNAIPLLGRVLAPVGYGAAASQFRGLLVPDVRTRLTVTRPSESDLQRYRLVPHALPVGFTDTEQADRCEAMLRNTGLTYAFARIVVWCAHGSASANNPHENAHDCGACGGKGGAPNARAISAMLNRPVVRDLLRQRGIDIPNDTWFVGAIHNTASDLITYFDTEDLPAALRPHFEAIVHDLDEASRRAAQERCRRFGSSPKDVSPEQSLHHVVGRSLDFSQVRPEWGHATNAFAAVGRRSMTQGVFFDRRGFVISYDASQDPTGAILERIVMAVGPVGAGINLEYYFSTVDPKVYGCDTKVPHNVTGMLGVMEGAQSDLRTGLPTQMTEVHEAMRLQLIIEAAPEVLGGIYGRQAAVRELLDGAWVHLVSVHPETGAINVFVPGVGFVRWNEPLRPIPEVAQSFDWYRGKYEGFLPPARVVEPSRPWPRSRPLPDPESAVRNQTRGAQPGVAAAGSL